jgi:hypothetical protein
MLKACHISNNYSPHYQVEDAPGRNTHSVWWQWVPNGAYTIPDFPVAPGDWMVVSITQSSTTNAET